MAIEIVDCKRTGVPQRPLERAIATLHSSAPAGCLNDLGTPTTIELAQLGTATEILERVLRQWI